MIQNHQRNSSLTLPLPHGSRLFASVLAGLLLLLLSGCASHETNRGAIANLHLIAESPSPDLTTIFAPVFVLSGQQESYNRIGRVVAKEIDGVEKITIDPDQPVIYADQFSFSTEGGTYINLVYRVHFQKTPFSLIPFHLGAGSNVGLLVIVTLSEDQIPPLVTTVSTCGCYAKLIPTAALPVDAYPADWSNERHSFYGEILPTGVATYTVNDALLITVRPKVHRVMDVTISRRETLTKKDVTPAAILPLQSLKTLALKPGKATSLYYDAWPLQGHVKGAIKPWESLLLSLVSLDFYVGMDKEYGETTVSGNPFYTSIFPWNRQASNMNNFAQFLIFRGWWL